MNANDRCEAQNENKAQCAMPRYHACDHDFMSAPLTLLQAISWRQEVSLRVKEERKHIVRFLREYAEKIAPKTETCQTQEEVSDAVLAGTVQAIAQSIEDGLHRE